MTAFAILLIVSEESFPEIRYLPYVVRDLTYFNLISTDFYFYPVMGILIPWLIWLLLDVVERPRPALPVMLIYSISAANASTRLWFQEYVCKGVFSRVCEVDFSLPMFLLEIVLWFIPLYALMKWISRLEKKRAEGESTKTSV